MDDLRPTITHVQIDFNDGTIIITVSEIVNSGGLDLSKLRFIDGPLNNITIELENSELTVAEGYNMTIQLSEEKRVDAIRQSTHTIGGDGEAILFEADAGSIIDVATNPILAKSSIEVTEIADTTKPKLLHAFVNYTDGTVHLTFSEIIDQSPPSDVDLSKFVIQNVSGSSHGIVLDGAKITSVDGTTLNITMTELQRVSSIAISGTPGGDRHPVIIDLQNGAIHDISQNNLSTTLNFPVDEYLDDRPPMLTSAVIDYGHGYMLLEADEFVDLTPIGLVNKSSLRLSNVSGDYRISTSYKSVYTFSGDGYFFNLSLTELQRVNAIANSKTSGGDGSPLVLDAFAGAFKDIGTNPSILQPNFPVKEIADAFPPRIVYAEIHYGLFYVKFGSNEFVDTTPESKLNLSNLFISNATGEYAVSMDLPGVSIKEEDGYNVTITITEPIRVAAMKLSKTFAGDGIDEAILDFKVAVFRDIAQNFNAETFSMQMIEYPDLDSPVFLSVRVNYSTGVLVLECQETLSFSQPARHKVSGFVISNTTERQFEIPLVGASFLLSTPRKTSSALQFN